MTREELINAICEEFDMAYCLTGLKPVKGRFGDDSSGCLVSTLARANGFNDVLCKSFRFVCPILKSKYNIADAPSFVSGIMRGFDNDTVYTWEDSEFQIGFEIGCRMSRNLFQGGNDAKPLLQEAPEGARQDCQHV